MKLQMSGLEKRETNLCGELEAKSEFAWVQQSPVLLFFFLSELDDF